MQATLFASWIVLLALRIQLLVKRCHKVVLVLTLTQRAVELLHKPPLSCSAPQQLAVQMNCLGSTPLDVARGVQREKESQPICTGPLRKDAGKIVLVKPTALQLPLVRNSMRPRMIAAKTPTLGLTLNIVQLVLLLPLTKAVVVLQEVTSILLTM